MLASARATVMSQCLEIKRADLWIGPTISPYDTLRRMRLDDVDFRAGNCLSGFRLNRKAETRTMDAYCADIGKCVGRDSGVVLSRLLVSLMSDPNPRSANRRVRASNVVDQMERAA